MNKIYHFLIVIDNILGRVISQVILLTLMTVALYLYPHGFYAKWLAVGLASYVILMVYDCLDSAHRAKLKEFSKTSEGKLGLVKGFTYSLLLGPLVFLLRLFFSFIDRDEKV